jgi:hypothetical protein
MTTIVNLATDSPLAAASRVSGLHICISGESSALAKAVAEFDRLATS